MPRGASCWDGEREVRKAAGGQNMGNLVGCWKASDFTLRVMEASGGFEQEFAHD